MGQAAVKVFTVTQDTNAAINAPCFIHAVHARNSGTGASSVDIHDATTVTGTAVISMAANTSDANVTFQEFYTVQEFL